MKPGATVWIFSFSHSVSYMEKIYYLHLKEGEKSASQASYVFSEYWSVYVSDMDILNYSLFFLFIRFYGEIPFSRRK